MIQIDSKKGTLKMRGQNIDHVADVSLAVITIANSLLKRNGGTLDEAAEEVLEMVKICVRECLKAEW